MTYNIDLGTVLQRSFSGRYSNLVTRPTGVAVRREIETMVTGLDSPSLTVIDFSRVDLLDFSCADEVVGKFMDGVRRRAILVDAYVLVRGARDDHLEAIEAVMHRYDLAVNVEGEDGSWQVVGPLDDGMRRALDAVHQCGRVIPADLAVALEQPPAEVTESLNALLARRLVMLDEGEYVSLKSVL